jgi:hypothetical protein
VRPSQKQRWWKDEKEIGGSLDRLAGTRFKTNIVTSNEEQTDNFGLINATSIKRNESVKRIQTQVGEAITKAKMVEG